MTELTLAEVLTLARRWWWILILLPLLAGVSAYAFSTTITPMYQARTMLLIDASQDGGGINASALQTAERLSRTYSELAMTDIVLDSTVEQLDDPEINRGVLSSMTSVSPIGDTQLLRVTVTDSNPDRAATVANVLSEVFTAQVRDQGTSVSVLIANPASPRSTPVSPSIPRNTALGGFLGVILAAGVIGLLGYTDNTVKTAEDVQRITGRSAIGLIPQFDSPGKIEPVVNPKSPASEAYRGLRTNLQFASMGMDIKALTVTSAGPSEGKSSTVMNLGVTLAQSGQRVILIDADLRRPSLHKLGGLDNRAGLTNMLIADAGSEVFLYCQKTDIPSLLVVPTGPLPPNPADVLNAPRMGEIVNQLKLRADIVLIDTPPLVFSDAQIVSNWSDGCLLVTQSGKTRSNDLRDVTQALEQTGSNVIGVVINRVKFGRAEYRRREYYTTYYNTDPGTISIDGTATGPAKRKWFGLSKS